MSTKIITIPILPHLVKFLDKEYPKKDDLVIIKRKIIPPKYLNRKQYKDYFTNPSARMVHIQVLTNDSRLYKIYSWIQHVDERFSTKMIDYVAARYGLKYTSVSIREFLSLYGITESDYAFETAYKKWQRSTIYKELRDKTHKSCQE